MTSYTSSLSRWQWSSLCPSLRFRRRLAGGRMRRWAGRGLLTTTALVAMLLVAQARTVTAEEPCRWQVEMLSNHGAWARWCYQDHVVEYNLEYRRVGDQEWNSRVSKLNWTLVTKLEEGATYEFRLRSRGDGDPYLETWGAATPVITLVYPFRLTLERVPSIAFILGESSTATLLLGAGGVPPLVHRLTPDLPEWLDFDAEILELSSTSTELVAPGAYRWKVTDQTGSNVWHEFTIEVRPADWGRWYDTNTSGLIERREVSVAIGDYLTDKVSRDAVLEVVTLYLSDTPIEHGNDQDE